MGMIGNTLICYGSLKLTDRIIISFYSKSYIGMITELAIGI